MKRRLRWIQSLFFAILLLAFTGDPLSAQEVKDDPEARAPPGGGASAGSRVGPLPGF